MSYQNRGRYPDFAVADRDRSRSRDNSNQGYTNTGGGGRGGGGGGGNSRGGYGGGGRDDRVSQGRPSTATVKLNYFKVASTLQQIKQTGTWIHYFVQVFPSKSTWTTDAEGQRHKSISPMDSRSNEGSKKEINFDKGSTPLSRRILNKLHQRIFDDEDTRGTMLAVDGSNTAYAHKRLFEVSGSDLEIPTAAFAMSSGQDSGATGIYGPADSGEPPVGQQEPKVGLTWDYCIKAHVTCDESDDGADRTKQQWFIVRIREVGIVQDMAVEFLADQLAFMQRVSQCLEIILKSTMICSDMICVGRSPRMFYLPADKQLDRRVLGETLSRHYISNGRDFAPFVGLSQAAHVCHGGNIYISADAGLDWFKLQYKDRLKENPQNPVMLLDRENKTICGVHVGDLHRPITNPEIIKKVKSALAKTSFNIRYTRPWPKGQEELFRSTLLAEGKDPATIEKKVTEKKKRLQRILNNRSVILHDREKEGIVMVANDPSLHSFEFTPRRSPSADDADNPVSIRYDVATYFREKVGLNLEFPCMPMVYTSEGYFPIEFAQQSFGKMKHANSPDQVKHVLGFNDDFSSTRRIDHLATIRSMVAEVQERTGQSANAVLRQFGVKLENEPLILTAKVLKEPRLSFRDRSDARLTDGSWNLLSNDRRDQRFVSPAAMNSFAVIDFTGEGKTEFIKTITARMKAHGMGLPMNVAVRDVLPGLTVKARSDAHPQDIYDAFKEAIDKSKKVFLEDSMGVFKRNQAFFRTNVILSEGTLAECILFPWYQSSPDGFEIVLPEHVCRNSHMAKANERWFKTRMKAIVSNKPGEPVDLFDLSWEEGVHCKVKGQPVSFIRFVWVSEDGIQFSEDQIRPGALNIVNVWQIEVPSVVFCQLPDDGKARYDFIKLVSYYTFGVQSQCLIRKKFEDQRNPDQYCSNIALKLNAKLSNKIKCAYAWSVEKVMVQGGIPWLDETPTMVMGLSMATASGEGGQTIVAASVCLKEGLQMAQTLRLQNTAGMIDHETLESITRNLAIQFGLHTGTKLPKRIIIYRNGSSEGNFEAIRHTEVASIRSAFAKLRQDLHMDPCPDPCCQKNVGCKFCTPIMTFVVALSQHNIRMVPEVIDMKGRTPRNVLSGTCLDNTINAYWDSQGLAIEAASETEKIMSNHAGPKVFEVESTHNEGFDFLLTAHGGLKGTSKPILYRVVLNENFVWKPDAEKPVTQLTKDTLQETTYHMSYQYATATKSVRMVPVVYYSNKLASVASGYIPYLIQNRDPRFKELSMRSSGDDGKVSFLRTEMDSMGLDESIESELLPAFSPYELKLDPEAELSHPWRAPFFTHMSA